MQMTLFGMYQLIYAEEAKRGWNNFHGGYGKRSDYEYDMDDIDMDKRAWNSGFAAGLGKRAWNSGLPPGDGKRARKSGFTRGLGKRAWNSGFNSGLGKRAMEEFQESGNGQGGIIKQV